LLDHIEVSLDLRPRNVERRSGNGISERAPPRLHYVRGHLVQRAGKSFWRSPHLRGDDTRSILSRTVHVTTGDHRLRNKG
jgi:hypothetical protein